MGLGITAWKKVTIADGQSLSGALDITGMRLVAIRQAADTEGAAFSFQASYDGGATYEDLYAVSEEQGTVATLEYTIPKSATVAQVIMLPNTYWIYGPNRLKVRTGTSASASAQSTAADIWLALEDIEAVNT